MPSKNVKIIGAGLGGLAAACLLASRGHQVSLFEKNDTPGGKINQIKNAGFRFDTGPSLLTMPSVLAALFEQCGATLSDHLTLRPLDPIARYFYPDGTVFDCHQNRDETLTEIERFAPEDVANYESFLDYSAKLYHHTENAFLYNPLYDLSDTRNINPLNFFKIDAFNTVARRVDKHFTSPYLRQFFKRFATYNGSSPFQAPATLNVIPHVELALGGYYVEGGMYRMVETIYRLALQLGVDFHFGSPIARINIQNDRVRSVSTESGQEVKADIVISNSDASETYLHLLKSGSISGFKKRIISSLEPSCSGFVLLLGINRSYQYLGHHNIFFSKDYEKEFHQLFHKKIMPDDPTIYIANTSKSNPVHAPRGGSNLFVLVNAPYLSTCWDWKKQGEKYRHFIVKELEKRGLHGLQDAIEFEQQLTPIHFYERYHSNKGSIYGTSSNSKMATFLRPKNKARHIQGLYLAGGSTHPGGGIPLVILSAMHAVKLIRRYD